MVSLLMLAPDAGVVGEFRDKDKHRKRLNAGQKKMMAKYFKNSRVSAWPKEIAYVAEKKIPLGLLYLIFFFFFLALRSPVAGSLRFHSPEILLINPASGKAFFPADSATNRLPFRMEGQEVRER